MTGKEKKALRRRESTRQLMGVKALEDNCIVTERDRLYFFLLRPFNLSVESEEDIRGHVLALQNLLRGSDELELLALDSCQSFEDNRQWYQQRLSEEALPAVRELLRQDMDYLNEIRMTAASDREFALVFRQKEEQDQSSLSQTERNIRDQGFRVRQANRSDLKRLLAIYYERSASDDFEDADGERCFL